MAGIIKIVIYEIFVSAWSSAAVANFHNGNKVATAFL